MEKFSQFRDRGSGIAPFLPIPAESSGAYVVLHFMAFIFRLFAFVPIFLTYSIVLHLLPLGALAPLVKKAVLWAFLGISGLWWTDLQIDGVKRGDVAKHNAKLPQPGSIIASSYTSPLDIVYLGAIFDPIFTASYPSTKLVQPISIFNALVRTFYNPELVPKEDATLVELRDLKEAHPDRVIVVFPECTTTNGRGILPFSPSLLSTSPKTEIFPVSIRYTPADVTTPIPNSWSTFFWNLWCCSSHDARIRIAESVHNVQKTPSPVPNYTLNHFDAIAEVGSGTDSVGAGSEDEGITASEKKTLDRIAESLARLGRSKRLGLNAEDKVKFVQAWSKRRL